ncbi:MAG: hypothetical protein UW70_C0016G0008 [Candidatus Peregrinibacteria bacterium GW2011_GWA2_44_7]|nr:MAG: hypothetical protein UW70_C0016G0008 [Candidatus Peregrinibacteria bacterium GW2011_GWA2_44_7]
MLLICNSIERKEIGSFSLKKIKSAAIKAKSGIYDNLRWAEVDPQIRKVKMDKYRFAFFFYSKKGTYIPFCIRIKQDKSIGNNMSFKNKNFERLAYAHLDLVEKDLLGGNFSVEII